MSSPASDRPTTAVMTMTTSRQERSQPSSDAAATSSSDGAAMGVRHQRQEQQKGCYVRPNRTTSISPSSPHQHQHQHYQWQRQLPALALALCVFFLSLPTARALTCYETVNDKTTIKQNDTWQYCALVPATMRGSELINGSQFGLGPENDMLGAYNTAFGMSMEDYRILTVCIYERYDFTRYLPIKPVEGAVEFAFRCVCNYDLCNSETTFSAYLTAIKADSYALASTDTDAAKRK